MAAEIILKLIALSLAKKVSVFVIARTYGFPRLYRKLMRVNRAVAGRRPNLQRRIRLWAQFMFRWPRLLHQRWVGSSGQAQQTAASAAQHVPSKPASKPSGSAGGTSTSASASKGTGMAAGIAILVHPDESQPSDVGVFVRSYDHDFSSFEQSTFQPERAKAFVRLGRDVLKHVGLESVLVDESHGSSYFRNL
ncbi:hypothetical protein FVE85_5194 [Porphyridium purpureum]|uniref:Uncharacterized protein n=1 Tax=Porphyridium purpureum TaxID=35688 RepID=A0A5J4Z145_PORPP|nr:hypothetical protein FVE85_5194 [Porphyridium purpureum]|eukprot:POR2151..scf295_1